MRFFTRELYDAMQNSRSGLLSQWLLDWKWSRADVAYSTHLASIRDRLPPSALALSDFNLHDGQITSARMVDTATLILDIEGDGYWGPHGAEVGPLVERLRSEPSEPGTVGFVLPKRGKTSVQVTFTGIELIEGLDSIVRDLWLYDELHLANATHFDLRVLLRRSELRIVAANVTWTGPDHGSP